MEGIPIGRSMPDTFWSREDDYRQEVAAACSARIQGKYEGMNVDERREAFNADLNRAYQLADEKYEAQQAFLAATKRPTWWQRLLSFFK